MWTTILLQYGSVFVPLGAVMALYALQNSEGWKLIVSLIISISILFYGLYALKGAIRMARIEEVKTEQKYKELIGEIKGLREDVKNTSL